MPVPSHKIIFIRSLRFGWKMKAAPQYGSTPQISCATDASPSSCFLKSTAFVYRNTRGGPDLNIIVGFHARAADRTPSRDSNGLRQAGCARALRRSPLLFSTTAVRDDDGHSPAGRQAVSADAGFEGAPRVLPHYRRQPIQNLRGARARHDRGVCAHYVRGTRRRPSSISAQFNLTINEQTISCVASAEKVR
jgi:hypothetical protein